MKRLTLLFCLLAVAYTGYASEQVYFKIAVNEHDYSTFLTDRISAQKSTLQYLATQMRQPYFHPERLNPKYYKVVESSGIKYFDRDVVQYDVIPILNDRFHHVLMVDVKEGVVIRKEVYDTDGKLVFAFTSLDRTAEEAEPEAQHTSVHPLADAFKGYSLVVDKTLKDGTRHMGFTDGLNGFSVFTKETESTSEDELKGIKRILYGNYIYRKRVGKELYTVVGSLPFREMELLVENIVKLEEKK